MKTAQAIAKQLCAEHTDALQLILEVARLVAEEQRAAAVQTARALPPLRMAETPDAIVRAVCAHYGVKQTALMSRSRMGRVALARSAAMSLMRSRLRMTFIEIGDFFERDHTTAMACIQRFKESTDALNALLDARRA